MKILPLILANILITTSSLLAEDVEKIIVDNKTPYKLNITLDTKPKITLFSDNKTTLSAEKFNLENTPIAYNIGFIQIITDGSPPKIPALHKHAYKTKATGVTSNQASSIGAHQATTESLMETLTINLSTLIQHSNMTLRPNPYI